MATVNIWNVEIATINEAEKKTEWRKIGVNLMWYQVLEVKRKYKGFITRHIRANNRGAECPTCGAFGGHWLACKSANAQAVRGTTTLALDLLSVAAKSAGLAQSANQ